MNLRDTGDLAAAGRGPRFAIITDRLNEDPAILLGVLIRLRLHVRHLDHRSRSSRPFFPQTITDLVEQKAKYLGFQVFRYRNFAEEGMVFFHVAGFMTLSLFRIQEAWTSCLGYYIHPACKVSRALSCSCHYGGRLPICPHIYQSPQ